MMLLLNWGPFFALLFHNNAIQTGGSGVLVLNESQAQNASCVQDAPAAARRERDGGDSLGLQLRTGIYQGHTVQSEASDFVFATVM